MFLFSFFSVFSLSVPGQTPEQPPTIQVSTPDATPVPSTPIATLTRDEEVSYVTVYLPEDSTSQALFIAMIVLLVVAFLTIIATIIYFCYISRKQSQIGAADFQIDDLDQETNKTKTLGTKSTRATTTTRGTRTLKTVNGRPMTATTTHAKSIYAVNTVIL